MRGTQSTDSSQLRAGVAALAIVTVAGIPSATAPPARERAPVAAPAPAATVSPSSPAPTPSMDSTVPAPAQVEPVFRKRDYSGAVECTAELVQVRADISQTSVAAVDPTGRYVVMEGRGDGPSTVVVVLRDGKPSTFTAPGEPTAVNAAGTIVGSGNGHANGWIRRNGRTSELATPDGFGVADPIAVNADGDVLGMAALALGELEGRRIVVWAADDPGTPRVLADRTTPEAVDFGPDGTVVGNVGRLFDTAAVVWDPDGNPQPLPVPAGWTNSQVTLVRGDLAFGRARPPQAGYWGIVWNLSTGAIDVWEPVSDAIPRDQFHMGNAEGWFVVGDKLTAPDGTTNTLPAPALPDEIPDDWQGRTDGAQLTREIDFVSADGTRLIGNLDVYSGMFRENLPMIWDCG